MGKLIDLGFCPRCKEDLTKGHMSRVVKGVKFCYLCSFEVEENRSELNQWISWAKAFKKANP